MRKKIVCVTAVLLLLSPGIVRAEAEIGVFLGGALPTKEAITEFEAMVGKDISSILWYEGWSPGYQPFFNSSFLEENIRYHDGYDTGTTLHITLEPWINLSDINSGIYDGYLQSYASGAKQWGDEIRLRFGHEMIQDDDSSTAGWYPWQDNPQEYKAAFQRIHTIFSQDAGADNVKFVWAANHHLPDAEVLEKYYPGPEYVDWIGIDGYNWGYYTANEPWGYWASFDEIFYDIYQSIVQNPDIFGDKPIMLGEFASAEGGLKAAWILEALQKIKEEYPEIEAFYWFNVDKERDWRVDSSVDSLSAFAQAISDAYFSSHPSGGNSPRGGIDPKNIKISANIPTVNMLEINLARIENGSWQNASNNVEFGALSYDQQFNIFRGNSYYAVDVGIVSNEPGWVITHTVSPVTNGVDTLDNNINVVFMKQNQKAAEKIGNFSLENSNGVTYNNTAIDNTANWLRIYYGIATGSGDASGVEPITVCKSAGTYIGSVTLTLTN